MDYFIASGAELRAAGYDVPDGDYFVMPGLYLGRDRLICNGNKYFPEQFFNMFDLFYK